MDDTTQTRWFHLTPGRFVIGLLAVQALLWLSECFGWLRWHKGYAVLTAVASVGVAMLVMLVWFAVALVFRCRFQFSLRLLLVMVVVVAVPCSWLAVEMKKAREQKAAVQLFFESGCLVSYDGHTDENGNLHVFDIDLTKPTTMHFPTVQDEGPLASVLGREFFHSAWAATASKFPLPGDSSFMKYTRRGVAEAMLFALKDLPDLRALDLSQAPVNDSDMEHVMPLKQLRQLDLTDSNVTDAGVAKLQQALPNCKIALTCVPPVVDALSINRNVRFAAAGSC